MNKLMVVSDFLDIRMNKGHSQLVKIEFSHYIFKILSCPYTFKARFALPLREFYYFYYDWIK